MSVSRAEGAKVSSIVAYSVFIWFLPGAHAEGTFAVEKARMVFDDPTELFWYAVLGGLCALMGFVYVKSLRVIERGYRSLRVPRIVLPAIGGASVGVFALLVGEATQNMNYNIFGGGHGLIQAAMDGSFTVRVLFVLLLAKIVATGITVGSGGSGGLFAPSLVVGALLGGLVGGVLVDLGYVQHAAPFVLVGMGGFFAGVGKVPITAVILVSEITKSYELLAPIMLAAAIAFQLSRNWTLFEEQVNNRLVSPAHSGDFVIDLLEQLYVRDVYDTGRKPTLIKESTPLRRVLILVAQSDSRYFPVVDEDDRMTGIFSLTDIRRVMTEHTLADLVLAKEIATEDILRVTPNENLNDALKAGLPQQFSRNTVETDASLGAGWVHGLNHLPLNIGAGQIGDRQRGRVTIFYQYHLAPSCSRSCFQRDRSCSCIFEQFQSKREAKCSNCRLFHKIASSDCLPSYFIFSLHLHTSQGLKVPHRHRPQLVSSETQIYRISCNLTVPGKG